MQVTGRIHALKISFQLAVRPGVTIPRFVYAYLVFGDNEIWLVDTGVAGSEGAIFDYLKAAGRMPEEISLVVQTHSHPDHIGAMRAIQRATGCSVAANEGERAWIEDVDLQFRERPVPGFHTLVGGSVKVDRPLNDGDVLRLDNDLTVQVLHTPGHSQGSISLWCPSERALICGDAVPLPGGIPIYDDAGESIRSLKKLMEIEGVEVLLSSWDEPRPGPEVQTLLAEGLGYLHRIHQVVLRHAVAGSAPDPMGLCRRAMADLGLPEAAVSPLVARTFMAHLRLPPCIRPCGDSDFEAIYAMINDAACAYKGVIPEDRWHEPYMSREDLRREIDAGVRFWGYEEMGELVGVMGIQDVRDVTLIRHAYVRSVHRNQGIGGKLLCELRKRASRPILIGTWAAATWAIQFYQRHGFRQVAVEEKDRLLREYWSIPERQVESSVLLADPSWLSARVVD